MNDLHQACTHPGISSRGPADTESEADTNDPIVSDRSLPMTHKSRTDLSLIPATTGPALSRNDLNEARPDLARSCRGTRSNTARKPAVKRGNRNQIYATCLSFRRAGQDCRRFLLILCKGNRSFYSPAVAISGQNESQEFALRLSFGRRKIVGNSSAGVRLVR